MSALVLAVFVSSLLGSLHCAGMCGGLVGVYAGADAAVGLRRGASHLAYNLGRLVSYALLGAVAGAAGRALDRAGAPLGLQRAALVVAGSLVLLWGAVSLVQSLGARVPRVPVPPALRRTLGRGVAKVAVWPPLVRASAIGLLTALLPCGWLWAFVVSAAGTGNAWTGALVMAVFWAGTLPALAAIGFGVQALAGPLRRYVPAFCAAMLMVVGLVTIVHRTRALDVQLPRVPASIAAATGDAKAAVGEVPPCCRKDAAK